MKNKIYFEYRKKKQSGRAVFFPVYTETASRRTLQRLLSRPAKRSSAQRRHSRWPGAWLLEIRKRTAAAARRCSARASIKIRLRRPSFDRPAIYAHVNSTAGQVARRTCNRRLSCARSLLFYYMPRSGYRRSF